MRDKEKDAVEMAIKRRNMLETAYSLFSEKGIEMVTMTDVAKASGYGIATLYRYFNTKLSLAVAVAAWAWERYLQDDSLMLPENMLQTMSAARMFERYLDFFILLYREHSDLLRFNQYFNIYIKGEHPSGEQLQAYLDMIQKAKDRFHVMYCKAMEDHTVRTDVPEDEMFTGSLHIMLAAAARYAIGLVYTPQGGTDAAAELLLLKKMFMREYIITA